LPRGHTSETLYKGDNNNNNKKKKKKKLECSALGNNECSVIYVSVPVKFKNLESAWMKLLKIAQFVKLTRRIKYNNLGSVHVMQKFWLVVYVIDFAQIWVR
jgi:hypothetical protein